MSHATGESILKDTIAEMTYPEVEAAVTRGAIALWGLGVIEQHGPHLPAATDVYIPSVRLRTVKRLLAEQGIEALIIPPFYWGVNHVSAAFPATIKVRPEIVSALITDVMASLAADGLRKLFCFSGHNDRAHNATIFAAMCQAAEQSALRGVFVAEDVMIRRLDVDLPHPHALGFHVSPLDPPSPYFDVHAGNWETSVMLAFNPEVVRAEKIPALAPTNLQAEDLAEWRKGDTAARRVTPLGYFGDPAAATAERGRQLIAREAEAIVAAMLPRLRETP